MHRSLRLNIAAGIFGMLWICAPLGAPLPLLMQAVEASSTQLGLLSAAWQAAMLAQIPAALFAESFSRRKPWWATVTLLHRILWAAPAVVPWVLPNRREWWPVALIASLALSNLLANLGTASWLSWMADIVPVDRAGRFWAVRQRLLAIGLVVGTAFYGWVLDRYAGGGSVWGFQVVFALCSFFGVVDVVVHCFVHEPLAIKPAEELPLARRLAAPFETPGFLRLTLLMAAWTCAQSLVGYTLAMPGFFSMVHLREAFGASYSQASLIFMAAALGGALFSGRLGPWMDRAGAVAVMTRLAVAAPISLMAWWLVGPGTVEFAGHIWPVAVLWMTLAALFQGAFCTGALLCQFRLAQMFTPSSGRTLAMAVHWSIAGLGGAVGGIGGGWVKDLLEKGGALPGGRYAFDALVLLSVLLTWGAVVPLCRRLAAPVEEGACLKV
jgi:Major Facilitator Superfamily